MAIKLGGVALALLAGCLMYSATPAAADIELKAACDGHWVTRAGTGFESFKVCAPNHVELRRRAHFSHLRTVRHRFARLNLARVHLAAHRSHLFSEPKPMVLLAAASPRDDLECVILSCPQFVLTGVGF